MQFQVAIFNQIFQQKLTMKKILVFAFIFTITAGFNSLQSYAGPFQLKDEQYEIYAEDSETRPDRIILTKVDLTTGKGEEKYRIQADKLMIFTNANGGFTGMEAQISILESDEFTMRADKFIFTANESGELNDFKAVGAVKLKAKENVNWSGLKEVESPEISFKFDTAKLDSLSQKNTKVPSKVINKRSH